MRRVFSSKGAYIVASLLVIMAMLLSACAPAATPSGGEAAAEPAAEGQTYRIAFSVPAMSFPFFVHMEKQVRDEAAKMGNVEIITLDGQDDTTKQVADLEGVIAQGYDGLIVSPRTSEGVAPVIQQVIDAGIPVVTIDRSAEGVNGLLAHVGADNVIGGEAQGQAILSLFPDGAKIIELLGTRMRRNAEYLGYVSRWARLVTEGDYAGAGTASQAEAADHADPNMARFVASFADMIQSVQAREAALRQELQQLRIEIDRGKYEQQLAEVTESEFFRSLQSRSRDMRRRIRGEDEG